MKVKVKVEDVTESPDGESETWTVVIMGKRFSLKEPKGKSVDDMKQKLRELIKEYNLHERKEGEYQVQVNI